MPFPYTFEFQFGGTPAPFTQFSQPRPGAAQLAVSTALGVDVLAVNDLDPNFSLAYGPICLAQDILHRWSESAGDVFYSPNMGRSLMQLINAPINNPSLQTLGRSLEAEAEKDQRVQSCSTTLTYDQEEDTVTIGALLGTADGTDFQFVATVDDDVLSLVSVSF